MRGEEERDGGVRGEVMRGMMQDMHFWRCTDSEKKGMTHCQHLQSPPQLLAGQI